MRLTDEGYIDDDELDSADPGASSVVDELPLQEREDLVYKLLASMPRAQIARVHRRIAPCVQMDIVGTLPSELALHVFSNLTWPTLLRCTLVSHRWRALANDNGLWKNLCAQRGWAWRWPRVPHAPVPLFNEEDSVEDFDDEGMGDDEELDAGSTSVSSSGTGGQAHVQTLACHRDLHSFGLPATPRIYQHTRAASTRRHRKSSHASLPTAPVEAGKRAFNAYRQSAPSALPSAVVPRPDYRLLHQTHVLLKNRLLHGSYRFSTLQTRGTPNAHTSIIYCLQLYTYAEDGRQVLFTGSKDRTVCEWNLTTGSVERVFKGVHTESVLSLCAHGNYLVTGGTDLRVCVWDLRDGSLVRTIMDHQDSVLCVRFDSERLVSCSKDRTIRLYVFNDSIHSSQPIIGEGIVLGTHRAAVNAVALAGPFVVSASGDKSLRVWDARTCLLVRTLEAHHARGIAAIDAALPLVVLSGSSDRHLRLYDIDARRGWSTAAEFHDPLPVRGAGLGDEGCPVCETCGGTVPERKCAGSRRTSVAASEMHSDLVRSVAIGSDFVLSGSYDQSIKVWDRETGSLVADLDGRHEGRVFCVGFDCTKIVSCGEDQRICMWDLSYGLDTSFLQL